MDSWDFIFGFVIILVSVLTIIGIWYSVKKHGSLYYRDNGTPPADEPPIPPPVIYGAWQGHSMGTTTMEPGDLTRIEKELRDAGPKSD